MDEESKTTNVYNILCLLGVLLIVLKLTDVIDWSWYLVTLPFWGGLALVLSIIIFSAALMGILDLIEIFKSRK